MRQPYDNLFSYYRHPSSRDADETADMGQQLEDNATKSLLNVMEHGDTEAVSPPILRALIDAVATDIKFDPAEYVENITVRTQIYPRQVDTGERSVYLYGLVGKDVEPRDPIAETAEPLHVSVDVDADESERRVDAVIEFGDDIVLIGEHKFQENSLSPDQLRRYATLYDVPESNYAVATWHDIYTSLDEVEGTEPVTQFLINQYREFLERWQLSFRATTSRFEGGRNRITIEHHTEPVRATQIAVDAQESPAPVALQFQTIYENQDQNGDRVIFTPSEWEYLMDDLDKQIKEQMVEGRYDLLIDQLGDEQSDMEVLASIEDDAGVRKVLRIDGNKSDPVISLQTWNENGSNLRSLPMMDESEFNEAFGDSSGLSKSERQALFQDGDFTVLLQD